MSHELFDRYLQPETDVGREEAIFDEDDREYQNNIKGHILEMLQTNSSRWVASCELIPITHRFSASIYSLRNEGHVIDKRHSDDGRSFEWRYLGTIEMQKVTDDWKARYYDSVHWEITRTARFEYDGYRCCLCGSGIDLQVHHWEYRLFNEQLRELTTLCRECHKYIHDTIKIAFPKSIPQRVFDLL